MGSLRLRLTAAFLLVALLTSGFLWGGAFWATRTTFEDYLTKQHHARAVVLADILAQYYRLTNSWRGVESLFPSERGHHGHGMGKRESSERIVLFAPDGSVLFDTTPTQALSVKNMKMGAVEIMVEGRSKGSVAVVPASPITGVLGSLENNFLSNVQKALWIAAVFSIVFGLFMGLWFSTELSKPIESLQRAADDVAKGGPGKTISVDDKVPIEVHRLVKAFNSMSKDLEDAEKKRKEITKDLAHEIRTPLTILKGNLEYALLKDVELDEGVLESMLEEVERLSRLVQSLSELDRISKGFELVPEYVSCSDLVEKAASAFETNAAKNRVEITLELPAPFCEVYVDPSAMQQVFSNLLSNALRFTPANSVIKIGAKNKSSSEVLFWVKDEGPGIPKEDLERVFERLFRGDPSRTRSTGGSGLGLAIAKGLVESAGGAIWAQNHECGAAFYFTLPSGKLDTDGT